MSNVYEVGPIRPALIDAAFPLVREALPEIGIDEWRSFCVGASPEPRSGEETILVATAPSGHVRGVCVLTVARDLLHGRLLDVSLFVVASAADEAGVASDLIAGLGQAAKASDCGALRIRTDGEDSWLPALGDAAIRRYGHILLPIAVPVSPPASP